MVELVVIVVQGVGGTAVVVAVRAVVVRIVARVELWFVGGLEVT